MSNKGRPELLKQRRDGAGAFKYILAALVIVFLAIILAGVWFRSTYTAYRIEKESMQNTLFEGDWVYAKRGGGAERGDIVILDVKDNGSFDADTIIKRLIAVEGDTVKCEDGKVCLRYAGTEEFVVLDEPYAVGACPYFPPCELQKGEIFVLGDNRGPSRDSTEVGPLRAGNIVAVVPRWAIANKGAIADWERFRTSVNDFFYDLFH